MYYVVYLILLAIPMQQAVISAPPTDGAEMAKSAPAESVRRSGAGAIDAADDEEATGSAGTAERYAGKNCRLGSACTPGVWA